MTVEIEFYQLMALVGGLQIPTWGLLSWILKIQRSDCQRLTKQETINEMYHPNDQ